MNADTATPPDAASRDDPEPSGWASRRRRDVQELLRHMRRRWYLYVPVFAIWGFAYARLFIDPTPRVPVLFNWTPSLPYRMALMQYGHAALQRGDLIVFSFAGEAQEQYRGLRGQPFFKMVRGLPGDVVTVQGRPGLRQRRACGNRQDACA